MTESWEEKTERLEREYQARIDKLRKELREMEEQKLHMESLLDERVEQCKLFESTNDALRQRLAELERDARLYVAIKDDWKELRIQQKRTIQRLQSQLATKDKRVAELEQKAYDLEMALGPYSVGAIRSDLADELCDIARSQDNEHWDEVLRGAAARIVYLQSQLAWTPVSAGLPTEPGYYQFIGPDRTTTIWELGTELWVECTQPEDPWSLRQMKDHVDTFCTYFRRIKLPKGGESRGCDCDTPTTVHDVACPMKDGET